MRRYLVRKQNLRIIGPMTFDELRRGIATMKVTLSDEVCCSLSPWVFLDDLENSRYVYPELGDLIISGEDVLNSDPSQSSDLSNARVGESKSSSKNSTSWVQPTLSFLGAMSLVVGLGVGGYFFYKKVPATPVNSKMVSGESLYKEVFIRYSSDWKAASDFVIQNRPVILAAMNREPEFKVNIMPYVRLYAILRGGGVFEGMGSEALIGNTNGRPCRVDDWRRIWKDSESKWSKISVSEPWLVPLLYDANWLGNRWSEGWLRPKNLEGACLILAEYAFRESFSATYLGQDGEAIRRRLSRFSALQSGDSVINIKSSHPLDILSCIEDSTNERERQECLTLAKDKEWLPFYSTAINLSQIYRGEVISGELARIYPVTGLSLDPEVKLLKELRQGKDLSAALRTTQEQYPQLIIDDRQVSP
jgi:hypothetical protein